MTSAIKMIQAHRAVVCSTRQSGFTFLEILLVLVIMGVLVGLTVPNLRGVRSQWMAEEATRTLVADLRQARINAIRTGATVEFVVAKPTKYEIFVTPSWSKSPENFTNAAALQPLYASRFFSSQILPRGVSAAPKGARLVFSPDGSSSGGEIRIAKSSGEVVYRIVVDEVTGSVQMQSVVNAASKKTKVRRP